MRDRRLRPRLMRLTQSHNSRKPSDVTSSGLHSTVISASSCLGIDEIADASRSAETRLGVPPRRKYSTLEAFLFAQLARYQPRPLRDTPTQDDVDHSMSQRRNTHNDAHKTVCGDKHRSPLKTSSLRRHQRCSSNRRCLHTKYLARDRNRLRCALNLFDSPTTLWADRNHPIISSDIPSARFRNRNCRQDLARICRANDLTAPDASRLLDCRFGNRRNRSSCFAARWLSHLTTDRSDVNNLMRSTPSSTSSAPSTRPITFGNRTNISRSSRAGSWWISPAISSPVSVHNIAAIRRYRS